jgi:hypothetical protein
MRILMIVMAMLFMVNLSGITHAEEQGRPVTGIVWVNHVPVPERQHKTVPKSGIMLADAVSDCMRSCDRERYEGRLSCHYCCVKTGGADRCWARPI